MPEAQSAPRRAGPGDLESLKELEDACFQPWRQASRASLRRSLRSSRQSVWVIDGPDGLLGSLVLWHHPKALRVYGVATHPTARGRGLGYALMQHAERLAAAHGATRVILEADPSEPGLVAWYQRQGYSVVEHRPDFYGDGRDAVRMEKSTVPP